MKLPVVWTISNSDCSSGTGIQSDLQTFKDFEVEGCSVITQLTAQNSFALGYSLAIERKSVVAQINALDSDVPANAIKLGALPNRETVEIVIKYLDDYKGFVVYDLELETSGEALLAETGDLVRTKLLPRVNLLVINLEEASALVGTAVSSPAEIVAAAESLLASGSNMVLITGAQFAAVEGKRFDYWSDGNEGLWISVNAYATINNRGGGCVLSAAIAAGIGHGMGMQETLGLAKAYVTQGISGAHQVGNGPGAVAHLGWPTSEDHMPEFSKQAPV
ncbi:MAG: bifunctional hydroxymethylpyrimidine kinase/phosphomethylpyrimidine kinase [Spongiibacteraceae bacterium]